MQAKSALLVVYLYFRIPGNIFQANSTPADKAVDHRGQGEYLQQDGNYFAVLHLLAIKPPPTSPYLDALACLTKYGE